MMQSPESPRFASHVERAPHITDPGGGRASPAAPTPSPLARLRDSVWASIVLKAGGGMIALCALGLMGAASLEGRPLGAPVAPAGTQWVAAGDASAQGASAEGAPAHGPAPASGAPTEPASAGSARGASIPCVPAGVTASVAAPPVAAEGGVLPDGRVVLNRASVTDLQRLPGIGQRRAEAIIELRDRLKKFRRGTDLLRVRGIGPKSLKRLEPLFVLDAPVDAAPTATPAPSAAQPPPARPASPGASAPKASSAP